MQCNLLKKVRMKRILGILRLIVSVVRARGGWREEWQGDEDRQNGKMVLFYSNGQEREVKHYKDGEKAGKWKMYFKNGQMSWDGRYKDGKWDGKFLGYRESGELKWEGRKLKGEWHGEVITYDKEGNIVDKGIWEHGKCVEGSGDEWK